MSEIRELEEREKIIVRQNDELAQLRCAQAGSSMQANPRPHISYDISRMAVVPDAARSASDFTNRRRAERETLRQQNLQLEQSINARAEQTPRQEPAAASSSRWFSESTQTNNHEAASSSNPSQGMHPYHPLEQPLSEKSRSDAVHYGTFEVLEDEESAHLLSRQERNAAAGSQRPINSDSAIPAHAPQIENISPSISIITQPNNARHICTYIAPLVLSVAGLAVFYKAGEDGWINVLRSLGDALIVLLGFTAVSSTLLLCWSFRPGQVRTQRDRSNMA